MFTLRLGGSAGLCVVAALWASSAHAGDVTCLWDRLSPATQDGLINLKSSNAMQAMKLSPVEARAVVVGCSVTPSSRQAASKALNFYALELAMKLKTESVVFPNPVPVEVVWKELPPTNRAEFRQWVASLKDHKTTNAESNQHFFPFLHQLGVVPQKYGLALATPQFRDALEYFMARAARESAEAEF